MKKIIFILLSALVGLNIYQLFYIKSISGIVSIAASILIALSLMIYELKRSSVEKELFAQKERFAAILNHDLKTPVIAQMRSIDMVINGSFGSINPEQQEILELTKNSCQDIYNMINALLAAYKFENNEVKLEKTRINFTELVMECCEAMQNAAAEKNIKFIIKPGKNVHIITGDINYLKPAVLYLIENSISFSFQNTNIEISISSSDEELTFEILTKSRRIPRETLKKMFHKYMGQISNYNKIGFCLKLNFCNEVIKAHHGRIIAESSDNDENILGFELPCSAKPAVKQ